MQLALPAERKCTICVSTAAGHSYCSNAICSESQRPVEPGCRHSEGVLSVEPTSVPYFHVVCCTNQFAVIYQQSHHCLDVTFTPYSRQKKRKAFEFSTFHISIMSYQRHHSILDSTSSSYRNWSLQTVDDSVNMRSACN